MKHQSNKITAVLEKSIREDDSVNLVQAISSIRGVSSVRVIEESASDWILAENARRNIVFKMLETLPE